MRQFIVDEDFHPEVKGYAELVRCKDCKYSTKVNFIYVCEKDRHYLITRNAEWFCADGEPKECYGDISLEVDQKYMGD